MTLDELTGTTDSAEWPISIPLGAFPEFRQFKRHADTIAWETEVWLAEISDHLIHFNGDKFLGLNENP